MPTVQFLSTYNGKSAQYLPPIDLASEHTTPQGLRNAFFERTGQQAFVLHDGGLNLGLEQEKYLVRLEGTLATASEAYKPLEHARAWQRPGWFAETLSWLNNVLGETVTETEQVSTNDLACVLRVQTASRTLYLKASEGGLEAPLTAQLAAHHPDLTPAVVIWDAGHNVLVTQDCGLRLSETSELAFWNTAVGKLAKFQRTADAQTFKGLGCPVHDFTALADRAETFLHDTATLRRWGLTDTQVVSLQAQLPRIRKAHEQIMTLELPLLPAHGDAHPMNALTGYGTNQTVWFDLSEGCLAHPLLDMGWFLAWLSHPARQTLPVHQTQPDAATEIWKTYLQALANYLPVPVIQSAEPWLPNVMILALMHRALVYHERFESWQGTVPGWRPQYVPYFLRSLLRLR